MRSVFLLSIFLTGAVSMLGQTEKSDAEIQKSVQLQFPENNWPPHSTSFFRLNKDTILACGPFTRDYLLRNVRRFLYLTFNQGKNWVIIDSTKEFSGHPAYLHEGKVWFNSDSGLQYSADFGATWATIPCSKNVQANLYYIFMQDTLRGIGYGAQVKNKQKETAIFITNNNWNGIRPAPTPLDQNKHADESWYKSRMIDKLERLDDILLVKQGAHIYYSRSYPINWKAFNVPVKDFSVDTKNKTIKLTGIRNMKYILNAELDLLSTFPDPETDPYKEPLNTRKVDVAAFLAPGIKQVILSVAEFHYTMKGTCFATPVYHEKVKTITLKDKSALLTLQNILTTCDSVKEPTSRLFLFIDEDLADYRKFYNKIKSLRNQETRWGYYHNEWVNIDHDLFLHPEKTTAQPAQENLQTVFNTYMLYQLTYDYKGGYITVNVVNNNSDTLKIKSKTLFDLYGLPYIISFRGQAFDTFDTRISSFLKSIVPQKLPFYNNLLAGELIFRLIEQRVIDETEYINGNK